MFFFFFLYSSLIGFRRISDDKPELDDKEYKRAGTPVSAGKKKNEWILEPSPTNSKKTKNEGLKSSSSFGSTDFEEDSLEDEFEDDDEDEDENEDGREEPRLSFSSSAERRRAVLEREIKKADSSSSLCSPQEYEILKVRELSLKKKNPKKK